LLEIRATQSVTHGLYRRSQLFWRADLVKWGNSGDAYANHVLPTPIWSGNGINNMVDIREKKSPKARLVSRCCGDSSVWIWRNSFNQDFRRHSSKLSGAFPSNL